MRWAPILLAVVCATAAPEAQAPQASPDTTFRSSTTAVVVDVVVRDGQGQPVRGLTLQDFQLREDGVQQVLQALDAIGAARPAAATASAVLAPATSAADGSLVPTARARGDGRRDRRGRLVALVFDRLSPEARALAYDAALKYVETSNPEDKLGVFMSDLRVETIQDYTSDREALRRAVRDAAARATAQFDLKSILPVTANPEVKANNHPGVPDVAGAEYVGREVEARDRPYDARTLDGVGRKPEDTFWERLARDQQGFATTNTIEAIAAGLAGAPGRKALVFFAEGLALPDAVLPQFERAIATANSAQVSVYSVDAKGLRVHSDQAEIRREVGAIGAAGLVVAADGGSASSLSLLERNEDVLRKDAETSLRLLANRTGGLLVNNTNDLSRVAGLVDLDFREHYVLTYQPKNADFRGEWRRIEVRVPGRRVTVRARAGYLAVKRDPAGGAILAHEARAFAALDQTPAPTSVPIQAAVLSFPGSGDAARLALLVSTPLAAVATTTGDRYDADFTILARIRDASGSVVRTASEPYRVGGPLTASREVPGRVLFFRHPQLPPGSYRLEVAIADGAGVRAGVARRAFDVPAPSASGLTVSSLILVEHAESAGAAADPSNPLVTDQRFLYPLLGGVAPAGPNASLGVFVRLLGPAATGARLELWRDGTALSQVPLELPKPDAAGRVDYQAQLPIGSLPAGTYELRLSVQDGAVSIERRAAFRRP